MISLPGLTPPHFCTCPNPGPRLQTSYVLVRPCVLLFGWEAVVRFVDVGRWFDHLCLNKR
jgi:hypothetical protein